MTHDPAIVHGSCHCGGVKFSARLIDGLREPRRCNCSLCRMRDAVVVTALHRDVVVIEGDELLTLYQFNTGQAEHYFCSRCGIYPFHRRRSNPEHMSVNVACLEGVSPFGFECVPVYEGEIHPRDRNSRPYYQVVGELIYRDLTNAEGPSSAF
jgi:hypothetical protein